MKLKRLQPVLSALALPLLATTGLAQQMVGQSHPDQLDDTVATSPAQADHYVKPSHTVEKTSTPGTSATPAPIVPAYKDSYAATGPVPSAAPSPEPALVPREPASIPSGEPSQMQGYTSRPVETAAVVHTPPARPSADDDGIVLSVPVRAHELNDGTLLRARLQQAISTEATRVGTPFSAELLADVGHSGEVMLPAGSIIRGRITAIHGGKRIGGPASIRLQPSTVTLPDGTIYPLAASLSDLDGLDDARVDDEGVIKHRNHPVLAAGGLGLTTGSAAVAGAMIGGGVGAAVGAGLGAGAGAIWFAKRDVQESLPAGTDLVFSLDQPLNITPHYRQ